VLVYHPGEHISVGAGAVVREHGVLCQVDLVRSMCEEPLREAGYVVAEEDGGEVDVQLVSEAAALAEQLIGAAAEVSMEVLGGARPAPRGRGTGRRRHRE